MRLSAGYPRGPPCSCLFFLLSSWERSLKIAFVPLIHGSSFSWMTGSSFMHKKTWDLARVLDFLKSLGPIAKLSLRALSQCTLALLLIYSWCQISDLLWSSVEPAFCSVSSSSVMLRFGPGLKLQMRLSAWFTISRLIWPLQGPACFSKVSLWVTEASISAACNCVASSHSSFPLVWFLPVNQVFFPWFFCFAIQLSGSATW